MSQRTIKPPHMPASLLQWLQHLQPTSREECRNAQRPCPHVACIHHLYFASATEGDMQIPNKEIWEFSTTCRLDLEEQDQPPSSHTALPLQTQTK